MLPYCQQNQKQPTYLAMQFSHEKKFFVDMLNFMTATMHKSG